MATYFGTKLCCRRLRHLFVFLIYHAVLVSVMMIMSVMRESTNLVDVDDDVDYQCDRRRQEGARSETL